MGKFGALVYAGYDWADVALSRRAMELMAREVNFSWSMAAKVRTRLLASVAASYRSAGGLL